MMREDAGQGIGLKHWSCRYYARFSDRRAIEKDGNACSAEQLGMLGQQLLSEDDLSSHLAQRPLQRLCNLPGDTVIAAQGVANCDKKRGFVCRRHQDLEV